MEGLIKHKAPLDVILSLAETGFPQFSLIRRALFALAETHNIIDAPKKMFWQYAGEAADSWRVLCRHIYELAKKGAHNFAS